MKALTKSTSRQVCAACLVIVTMVLAAQSYATLPPTNNLVLWLKSDTLSLAHGAGVTTWSDSSGNGNDAILYAAWDPNPAKFYTNAINGRPAVGFGAPGAGGFGSTGNDALFISNQVAGTFQAISLPAGFTFATAFKTFVTGDDLNFATGAFNYNNMFADTATASQYGLSGGSASLVRYDNQVSHSWHGVTGGGALNNTNVYQGHFLIATHAQNPGNANDTINLYADNGLVASGNIPYNSATDFRRVGQGPGGGGNAFNGLIGEFLVYSTALTGAEQEQLSTYLTEQWLDIPEPSAAALLLASAALLWRRRTG
jgi:hypothetical protein